MAPDWISNLPINVKVDVYSYGQMLLELVSGRKNFNPTEIPSKQYYPDWLFNEMVALWACQIQSWAVRSIWNK